LVTALTLYGTNTTSSTIATAGLLVSITGASNNTVNTTKCGQSTGYSEIYGLGTTAAWQSAGGLDVPGGTGWILDGTTLDGQQLISGTWTPTIQSAISVGTATADMYVRAFKLGADHATYTAIGTMSLLAQSLTTTITQYTFAGNTLPAMSFAGGEKLYIDVWYDITVNGSGSNAATIKFANSNNASQGRATYAQIATAGYQGGSTSTIVITDVGLNLIRAGLSGADSPAIRYVAVGTSNTAPTSSDTQLGNETYRSAVSAFANGSVGEILTDMYMSTSQGNGLNIQEVGFFGGSSATPNANSGILMAHGLYNHNPKVASESITFEWDNTFHT
jgi:hypothetical protein